jgi:enoyl-CoA hydratase/carnithine racemase
MREEGALVARLTVPRSAVGLNRALWCDYRICTDNPKTKMGLPEVKLGQFLRYSKLARTRWIANAMDMMLTGKEIRPDKARKMGLVDMVVDAASLEEVAIKSAEDLANGTLKVK